MHFFDKTKMRATITNHIWEYLPSIVVYDYEKIMDITCTCVEKNGKNFDDERRKEGRNERTNEAARPLMRVDPTVLTHLRGQQTLKYPSDLATFLCWQISYKTKSQSIV